MPEARRSRGGLAALTLEPGRLTTVMPAHGPEGADDLSTYHGPEGRTTVKVEL